MGMMASVQYAVVQAVHLKGKEKNDMYIDINSKHI